MATVLQHKRSSTASDVPSTSALALGEIAVNTNDGYLFLKKDVGGTESIVTFRPSSLAYEDSVYIDTDTGDGTTVAFTLTTAPKDEQYVFVTINGVQQHVSTYSVSGTSLTFSTAPANGDAIEFRVLETTSTDVSLRDKQKYFYSITSTTSSVTGADDNGLTLTYDAGKVDVFQNGVKLIEGSDYTASTGTSIAFTTSLESGDIVEIDSWASAAILDADGISPFNATLSGTTAQTADVVSKLSYRTVKYVISATHGTDFHSTELILVHDGTTVYMTEYATIYTSSSLAAFDADISGNYIRLRVTPTNSSGDTVIKGQRITVTV